MRLHISLDDRVVEALDRRVGRRRRSAFIAETVRRALEDAEGWDKIAAAVGTISDGGHEWDDDLAGWVRAQRRSDPRRVG